MFSFIEPGVVNAVVGGPGVGKTSFCLTLSRQFERPYFIDTEGLSLNRVEQVGAEHIRIARIREFEEQDKLIKKFNYDADLLIIDSLVMLYRLKIADDFEKANSMLTSQIYALHNFAEKQDIPVVITGHVYTQDNKVKIVGGDIMKYWAKSVLLLKKSGKAVLLKHRSLPRKEWNYKITGEGLRVRTKRRLIFNG